MKKYVALLGAILLLSLSALPAFAAEQGGLEIELISPGNCEDRPVFEEVVVSCVTNNTSDTLENLLVYITIIDTRNNIAVAVDEYGSTVDKPRKIERLAPGESVEIEIPIRFMYVGDFELYTSVMHKASDTVVSAAPITLNMLGDSHINPQIVTTVSAVMPLGLLACAGGISIKRKREKK